MDARLARGRRWFEYHCYEGEDSADAIAWHHTHQQVTVLSKQKDVDIETGNMYRVRFNDGIEWDVFNDELVKSIDEFYRPEYKTASTRKGEMDYA